MANQPNTDNTDNKASKNDQKPASKKLKTSTVKDEISAGRTMTGAKPDQININPVQEELDDAFDSYFESDLNELTMQQRIKKGINLRRIENKVQSAKKRALLRKGTAKVIAKRAKRSAIMIIKTKLAGNRNPNSLSPMEKQRIEDVVRKRKSAVNRLALRLIPKVKKKEAKRFLKKEEIDLDNLVETIDFINEAINSSGGGAVRGMGHSSGNPDGEPSNYVTANIADSDKKNDNLLQQKKEFHDNHHVKEENLDRNDSHLRDDGTSTLVKVFKADTPGETNKVQFTFKRTAKPVPKNVDEAFDSLDEAETREAIPRSGQPRKSIDLVVRSAVDRKVSSKPYRQQSIQKKIIDEEILEPLYEAVDSIDRGEYDYEGAMARTQLQTIARNAKELVDMLKADENMPEWVQNKITKAEDYITAVNDYLKSRQELGESYHVKHHSVYGKVLAKNGETQMMSYDRAMHHASKHGGSLLKTMTSKKYIVKLPETMEDGHSFDPSVREDMDRRSFLKKLGGAAVATAVSSNAMAKDKKPDSGEAIPGESTKSAMNRMNSHKTPEEKADFLHKYMKSALDKGGFTDGRFQKHVSSLKNEDLRNWFNPKHPEGGWKRINSKGEAIGPCAREEGEPKPKCMSNEKRAMLTKKERASAVRAKRKHDSNPERKGDPINVSNFGKGKISENIDYIEEKNSPTNPALWSKAKSLARSKFDVYPSAYANGWAAKWYKSKGGGWKTVSEESVGEAYGKGYKSPWEKITKALPHLKDSDKRTQQHLDDLKKLGNDYQAIVDKEKKKTKPSNVDEAFDQIDMEEGWKSKVAGAALLGMGALAAHSGKAHASDIPNDLPGKVAGSSYPTKAPVGTKYGSFIDQNGRKINKYVDHDLTTRFHPDDQGEWKPDTFPTRAPVGTKYGSYTDKNGKKWDKHVGHDMTTDFKPANESAAWQRKEGKNPEGGLNKKGVASYRRENPGSKLQTAVTTKPSKLDPDSKAAKRRKSFCARMTGMKKQNTSAETANDPDSRINKSLRKWNC